MPLSKASRAMSPKGGSIVGQQMPKSGEPVPGPSGDSDSMDQRPGFKNRFCWPAQDRARAKSPSKAPRKSSVFTASDCFIGLDATVESKNSRLLRVSSHCSRQSTSVRRAKREVSEFGCGCWKVSAPGQSSRSENRTPQSNAAHLWDADAVDCGWEQEIASGTYGSCASSSPDWRIIGEQDV